MYIVVRRKRDVCRSEAVCEKRTVYSVTVQSIAVHMEERSRFGKVHI